MNSGQQQVKRSVSITPLKGVVLTIVVAGCMIGIELILDATQSSLLPPNEKLVKAVESGNQPRVRYLLEHGADANYIYAPRPLLSKPWRWPMIQMAQDSGTAQILLDHGARVDAKDMEGNTALYYAIRRHNTGLVQLLQRYGAKE